MSTIIGNLQKHCIGGKQAFSSVIMNPIVLFISHIKPHNFKWDTLNPILSYIYIYHKNSNLGFKVYYLKVYGLICPKYKIVGFYVLSSFFFFRCVLSLVLCGVFVFIHYLMESFSGHK